MHQDFKPLTPHPVHAVKVWLPCLLSYPVFLSHKVCLKTTPLLMASLAFLFCVHISLFLHFIKAYLGRWQTGHTCLFLTEVLSKDFDRRLQCGVGSLALDFLFINVSVLDNSRNNMFLLPKHRQVLLEIFSKNYRVRRNMIQARLTQECGEDLSKQEVDKVLKVHPFLV